MFVEVGAELSDAGMFRSIGREWKSGSCADKKTDD